MSGTSNIITAEFHGKKWKITGELWQYDYGQYLEVYGLDLPFSVEFHFSQLGDTAITNIGETEDGKTTVQIPSILLTEAAPIDVYIFLHVGPDDGETEYHFILPIKNRSDWEDVDPTPDETALIGQLIATLNDAVDDAQESARNAASSEANAATSETNAASSERNAAASEANAAQSERTAVASAESAQRDAASASSSATSAEQSADRAEQAANTAGYIDMEIDANGHLIYTKTSAVDVDFALVDGHLVMEV